MTPLKETLEAAIPAGEGTSTQGSDRAKSDAGHLRSDAVSLDVPVKIHGSRVTEVVRGVTPHTEPFEEQTSTMIVFPQGGVVKMAAAVTVGQMVVLTNLKSGHDAICRVVKVRAYAKAQSYVELEFTNRQPGYWGVYFPSEKAAAVPKPPVAPTAPDSEIEKVAHSQAPAVAPPPPVQPPAKPASVSSARSTHTGKPESSFVGIGSQEDVQPAASATGGRRKESFAAPAAPVSMAELRGDAHAAPPIALGAGVPGEEIDLSHSLAEPVEEEAPATFGRFAAGATLGGGSQAPVRQPFGAHFEAGSLSATASSEEVSKPKSGANGFLIAASIVIAFVLAAGGVFYFKVLPVHKAAIQPVSAVVPPSVPAAAPTASAMPIPTPPAPVAAVNSPALASEPPVVARVTEAPAPKPSPSRALSVEPAQPKPAPSPKAATVVPDISASLSAHPKSSQRTRSSESDAAPSLDMKSSSAENNVLSGIAAPSVAAPPPPQPAAEAAPVRIGGNVKPPKLISSVLPIYPTAAKIAGIEGRVVIETSVEKDGSVSGSKVISGSPVLRQAALDALRQWKYQPGTLNGEPIAVQISVTIDFHR